jgi:opine dehydrogenase
MKFTIIGTGNTGHAMACYILSKGYETILYSKNEQKVKIIKNNGIQVTGAIEGCFNVSITSNICEAVTFGDCLIICTTAQGHQDVCRMIKPHVKQNQTIIIFNGNWGALEFKNILSQRRKLKNLTIAETGAMMFICKSTTPGKVHIDKIKKTITLATLDKGRAIHLTNALGKVFPQFKPVNDVFETSLNNSNTIIHTPITLFNSARIDSGQDFLFYAEGASPQSIKYVETMDLERLELGYRLGIEITSTLEIINSFWVNKHENLYDAIHQNESYKVVSGPKTLNHRFITEDIPYGLVPLSELGARFKIPTPSINAMINAFDQLIGVDFRALGPDLDYESIINASTSNR